MKKKGKIEVIETKEEFQDRIIAQMQNAGFNKKMGEYTIATLENMLNEGKLKTDAFYQREKVWKPYKQVALIESLFRYGGKTIPTLTFRILEDGTIEVLDGKQRVSSIKDFLENKFRLKGNYEERLNGYTFKDLKKEYPRIADIFKSSMLKAEELTNMTDKQAVVYYGKVNTSSTTLTPGERILGLSGTSFFKTVESLGRHKVWQHVTNKQKNRYSEYEYAAKLLLFVLNSNFEEKQYNTITSKQLIRAIDEDKYYPLIFSESIVLQIKDTFDLLKNIFEKYDFKMSLKQFFAVACYCIINIKFLTVSTFGEFLNELCTQLRVLNNYEGGILRIIKSIPTTESPSINDFERGINSLISKRHEGVGWNEIKQLSSY